MIEIIIKTHFDSALDVDVYFEQPETVPESFVLIEKTGSGRTNKLNSSTFAFQSYAGSMYEAASLNEQVKAAAESLVTLDEIASVKLNSDYNFTDTETKRYRYQAVYDIKHY
jgi:hypothetical protein